MFNINKSIGRQKGHVLILVLLLLAVGTLLIVPLLTTVSSGIETGTTYDTSTQDLYSADAGIQDAVWQISSDKLSGFRSPAFGTDYSLYKFYDASNSTNQDYQWTYDSSQINGRQASITIQNYWIPKNVPIPAAATAQNIIENANLVVTGATKQIGLTADDGSTVISQYEITIVYPAASAALKMESIGIWLPSGFTYFDANAHGDTHHKSSLEVAGKPYNSTPARYDWAGNEAWIWTFGSVPFTSFDRVPGDPVTLKVTFYFQAPRERPTDKPLALSWVTTSGDSTIPFSWDADVKVFKMISVSGNTRVESYISKSVGRSLPGTISGDYYAIGGSLLTGNDNYCRITPVSNPVTVSSANYSDKANISAAYLYWSAWKRGEVDHTVSPLNPDNGSNIDAHWTRSGSSVYNNTAWGNPSGYYSAHSAPSPSPGPADYRFLTLNTDLNLSPYTSGQVLISWNQWVSSLAALFSDNCNNITTNWTRSGNNAYNTTAWNGNGSGFVAHNAPSPSPGPADYLNLTMTSPRDLSIYPSSETVTASWDQWVSGASLAASDGLDYSFYNSTTGWSSNFPAFRCGDVRVGTSQPASNNLTFQIPASYLTGSFKMRLSLVGFSGASQDCIIDNIRIGPAYTANDALYYAFSRDGGTSWGSTIQAFKGDIGSSSTTNKMQVPDQYLTSSCRIRFYVAGFDYPGMYCNIDNIQVQAMTAMNADTSIVFKINGQQVSFDAGGHPQTGTQELTATRNQTMPNYSYGGSTPSPNGYSYACFRDVTGLVTKYTAKAPNPATNYPGFGTYQVSGVDVSGVPPDSENQWAYAGWSLIFIYTSPDTQGHQLYLYDKFTYSGQDATNGVDVDFDWDGQPGGTISGFFVPQRTTDPATGLPEVNSARITCFVGEGDSWYDGDFLSLNAPDVYRSQPLNIPDGYKLWDHTGNVPSDSINNVWNSKSIGLNADGIDVDTFNVTWDSGLIGAGNTSAHFDMVTKTDVWNLVYMIMSFRSETTRGGAISYLIKSGS